MAHYKRGYPRSSSRGYHISKRSINSNWLNNYPRWWDVVFHTRPTRVKNKRLLRKVKLDISASDEVCFYNGRKPHKYYW